MNARGKQKLIKSLAEAIQEWIDDVDPNSSEDTDVGYIGNKTIILMATQAITALELNSEAQRTALKQGFIVDGG